MGSSGGRSTETTFLSRLHDDHKSQDNTHTLEFIAGIFKGIWNATRFITKDTIEYPRYSTGELPQNRYYLKRRCMTMTKRERERADSPNGRDSSQGSVLSHAHVIAEAEHILQGNKARHASMAPAIQKSKVSDTTVSHLWMRLPSWRFGLPSQ